MPKLPPKTKPIDGVTAYPLAWPPGVARTKDPRSSNFATVKQEPGGWKRRVDRTVFDSYRGLMDELRMIKAVNVVVSTNIQVRADGTPWSDRKPVGGDAAVAVYWSLRETVRGRTSLVPHSIQCDRWDRVADNLYAVTLSLEALRGITRWGAVSQHQALGGLRALPPGSGAEANAAPAKRPWREVLEIPEGGWTVDAPPDAINAFAKRQFRTLAAKMHPDRLPPNASEADRVEAANRMAEVTEAMEDADAELQAALDDLSEMDDSERKIR